MSAEPFNFNLTVDRNQDNTFRIKGRYEQGGEVTVESVAFPLGAGPFRQLVSSLSTRTATAESALAAGTLMRQRLFPGEIWNLLRESRLDAEDKGHQLRCRLMINAPQAAFLPWEYCYDPEDQGTNLGLLAQRRDLRFVRYIEDRNIPSVLDAPRPMKVLITTAQPAGWDVLDIQAEVDLIEQELASLKDANLIETRVVHNATRAKIDRELEPEIFGPHVFHFVGHGQYEFNTDVGGLVLEDSNGEEDILELDDIRALFAGSSVRVAVLNACKTAAASPDPDHAFMGIAQSMVKAGVPAVFAMQFAVPDEVAKGFARVLYERLSAGVPLDAAVSSVRRSAYTNNQKVYWGIPVLFMRSPDGRLWQAIDDLPASTSSTARSAVSGVVGESGDPEEERFRRVMNLDYRAQNRAFHIFRPERFAAYLVHGEVHPDGDKIILGTNLLALQLRNLLFGLAPDAPLDQGFDNLVLPVKSRLIVKNSQRLWRHLCENVGAQGLTGDYGESDRRIIAAATGRRLDRGHVLLVLHNVPRRHALELLTDFWVPLLGFLEEMSKAGDLPVTTFGVYAILVDPDGEIQSQTGINLLRIPSGPKDREALRRQLREDKLLVDLRPVTAYSEDALERWLESHNAWALLPEEFLDREIETAAADILENSDNGFPDDAIEYICCDLGGLSFERVETWLEI